MSITQGYLNPRIYLFCPGFARRYLYPIHLRAAISQPIVNLCPVYAHPVILHLLTSSINCTSGFSVDNIVFEHGEKDLMLFTKGNYPMIYSLMLRVYIKLFGLILVNSLS